MMQHADDPDPAERFEFGENWASFLRTLTDDKIRAATDAFCSVLGLDDLSGMSFLDVGSGSGLSSLVARKLGATVHSFDYDPASVACTREMRRRYCPDDTQWTVERGDALDARYMETLGRFDVVHSWGVLHHTGDMALALRNTRDRVKPGGRLFIAIYNDQGGTSRRWAWAKRTYNRLPRGLRFLILIPTAIAIWGPMVAHDTLHGEPFRTWREARRDRGMSLWHDLKDWAGGYPFEVAAPDAIIVPLLREGFALRNLVCRTTGHGCNEYVFVRASAS